MSGKGPVTAPPDRAERVCVSTLRVDDVALCDVEAGSYVFDISCPTEYISSLRSCECPGVPFRTTGGHLSGGSPVSRVVCNIDVPVVAVVVLFLSRTKGRGEHVVVYFTSLL